MRLYKEREQNYFNNESNPGLLLRSLRMILRSIIPLTSALESVNVNKKHSYLNSDIQLKAKPTIKSLYDRHLGDRHKSVRFTEVSVL